MGGGEGGDVDVFVGGLGWVQEELGDAGADGGDGGGVEAGGAGVVDCGRVVGEGEAEEAGCETPRDGRSKVRLG